MKALITSIVFFGMIHLKICVTNDCNCRRYNDRHFWVGNIWKIMRIEITLINCTILHCFLLCCAFVFVRLLARPKAALQWQIFQCHLCVASFVVVNIVRKEYWYGIACVENCISVTNSKLYSCIWSKWKLLFLIAFCKREERIWISLWMCEFGMIVMGIRIEVTAKCESPCVRGVCVCVYFSFLLAYFSSLIPLQICRPLFCCCFSTIFVAIYAFLFFPLIPFISKISSKNNPLFGVSVCHYDRNVCCMQKILANELATTTTATTKNFLIELCKTSNGQENQCSTIAWNQMSLFSSFSHKTVTFRIETGKNNN